jgi:uncharacterized protein (DUF924 family)
VIAGGAPPEEAQDVLDHWFGAPGTAEHGTVREFWFKKRDATDRNLAERFGPLIERALRGELAGWAGTSRSALAQILLLDQFTRNVFRHTPRAFAGDPRALNAALAMVGARQDEGLLPVERLFVYMPFEHSESIAMQDESIRLFARLAAEAPTLTDIFSYAEKHRVVVQRFGRFPHRNEILRRQSTPEETAFLREPGSRF